MYPRLLKQLFDDASQDQLRNFLLNHLHVPEDLVDDPFFSRENSHNWAFAFERYIDYIRGVIGRSTESDPPSSSPTPSECDSQEEPDPNPPFMPQAIPSALTRASKSGSGYKRKHNVEAEQEAQLSPNVSQRMTRSMSAASIEALKLAMSSASAPPSGATTPASSSSLSPATQSANAATTRVRRPNDGLHWAKGGPASARPKTSQKPAKRSSQVIRRGRTNLHIFDEDKIIFDISDSPVARRVRRDI